MNDGLIAGLSIMGIITVSIIPFIVTKIIKYKLEVEKLRLDAEIKKEEIRAKNQFEIEKMILIEKDNQKCEPANQEKSKFYDDIETMEMQSNRKKLQL